jgi:two-component system cell cycle response regulator DivK
VKVLVLEANELDRDLLARRLTRRGHSVVTALNVEQGIALAQRETPDAIIADIMLLLPDEWALPRRLAEALAPRSIPVIALSARDMPDDRAQALAAGCADYETKPLELQRLLNKLAALGSMSATTRNP